MTTLLTAPALSLATAASVAALSMVTAAAAQDYTLPSTFGEIALVTGYLPDPATVDVLAGGALALQMTDSVTGGRCAGHFAEAPDFRLHYQAGQVYPLTVYVESQADTVLMINAPDGSWYCNDDFSGLDPAIGFDRPLSGQYDIWVGTYAPIGHDGYPPALLSITELEPFAVSYHRAFFGQDDRVVVEAPTGPWAMIGLVELEDASCTGTLIGPDVVLTAAHCIVDAEGTRRPLQFYAGASDASYVAMANVVDYHVPEAWMAGSYDGADFAFLTLDQPIGDQIGWMDVGPLTRDEGVALLAHDSIAVMQGGYSADQPDVITANLDCPILAILPNNTISHQCDTLQGDSGSPLFIETAGGYRIIGVESHTAFRPDAEWDLNVAMYAGAVEAELVTVSATGGILTMAGK
jgi:V8-like Glu-specific endopeptidase